MLKKETKNEYNIKTVRLYRRQFFNIERKAEANFLIDRKRVKCKPAFEQNYFC